MIRHLSYLYGDFKKLFFYKGGRNVGIGQTIAVLIPSLMVHTPKGLFALSLVQFGTLLL
jgi:hypothetical protein